MKVFKQTRKFFFTHFYFIFLPVAIRRVGYCFARILNYLGRKTGNQYLSQARSDSLKDSPNLANQVNAYFSPLLKHDLNSVLDISLHYSDWLTQRNGYKDAIQVNDKEAILLSSFVLNLRKSIQAYRIWGFLLELGTYFLANFTLSIALRNQRNVKRGIKRFICRILLNSVLSTAIVALLTYLFSLRPWLGGISSLFIFIFRLWFMLFSAWILQGERKVDLSSVYKWKNASGFYLANFVLKFLSTRIRFLIAAFFHGSYPIFLLSSSFYRYADNILIYQGEGYVARLQEGKRK